MWQALANSFHDKATVLLFCGSGGLSDLVPRLSNDGKSAARLSSSGCTTGTRRRFIQQASLTSATVLHWRFDILMPLRGLGLLVLLSSKFCPPRLLPLKSSPLQPPTSHAS